MVRQLVKKVKDWFKKPAVTLIDKAQVVVRTLLVNYLWLFLMFGLFAWIGPATSFFYQESTLRIFFFMCIVAPIWEEAAFRYAPIEIARGFGKQFIWPVIILSSVLFGWGHPTPPQSLLIQGVFGLTASWVYLKAGYWTAVAVHFIWNLIYFLQYFA